jgi:hypothetical protein
VVLLEQAELLEQAVAAHRPDLALVAARTHAVGLTGNGGDVASAYASACC